MRNRTEAQVTLVLIRHGATQANEERRYLGRTEEGLSPQGRAALKKDRARQRYPRLTHLFASPMKRCLETAELLYPKLLYPQLSPVVIPEWREMDFGLQGMPDTRPGLTAEGQAISRKGRAGPIFRSGANRALRVCAENCSGCSSRSPRSRSTPA